MRVHHDGARAAYPDKSAAWIAGYVAGFARPDEAPQASGWAVPDFYRGYARGFEEGYSPADEGTSDIKWWGEDIKDRMFAVHGI